MDCHALAAEVQRFDSSLPIERALTPPASWYQGQDFFDLDRRDVFAAQWVVAARLGDLQEPGSYVAGDTMGWPWVVVRDADGELRGFHNACRHHATVLLDGVGRCERIVCPYHGWSYGLDGALSTAPHMAGVADFDRDAMGLAPLGLRTWRRWVFLRVDGPAEATTASRSEDDQAFTAELARIDTELERLGADELVFHGQRTYQVHCNWKVFVDNYLDGGYHVPQLHRQLSSRLDLDGYATELLTRSVLQTCPAKTGSGRLGPGALYVWLHPNLCINRYGEVMDVNIIRPLGPELTEVIFEDYRHPDMSDAAMTRHLAESERVQQEDMEISRSVQIGLGSPGYDRGRYAPGLEGGEHLFHRLLRGAYHGGLAEAGERGRQGR